MKKQPFRIMSQTLAVYTLSTLLLSAHAAQLGDIAPRGTPDGQLNAADLSLMQQLVLGQLTATSEELILGDVAPYSTGDDVINGADMLILIRAILGEITLGTTTPQRGTYLYSPQPVPSLNESHVVEFHPDGSYAIILQRNDTVHIYEWSTQILTRIDLQPGGGNVFWGDVAFEPNGSSATLVGSETISGVTTGVVYQLDDALLRDYLTGTQYTPITKIVTATGSNPYVAIAYPWQTGTNPVILERTQNIAILREYNTAIGNFEGLLAATNTSAGCDDIAFVDDEFGEPGILVVCGLNGSDALFYAPVSGIWRTSIGNSNIGNVSKVAAHNNGDYALLVSWSSRRLFRFQDALINNIAEAPWFPVNGVYGIKFQDTGQRALILGRASGSPLSGTVIEYRHDEYICPTFPSASCGLTDVSIPNFDMQPYNATSNTYLLDAAFRPGCDGGLIVGGESSFSSSTGLLIEFQIEGTQLCR